MRKWIKKITVLLLFFSFFAETAYAFFYFTKDTKIPLLVSYQVTSEDTVEWDKAADCIVKIVLERKPYYLAEKRKKLSQDEAEKWYGESKEFAERFLSIDKQGASAARDITGRYYIKSKVEYTLFGDDPDFYENAYIIPYKSLKSMQVKIHIPYKKDITDVERMERDKAYNQLAKEFPDFFNEFADPMICYCLLDAMVGLQ